MRKARTAMLALVAFLNLSPGIASASTSQVCDVKMVGFNNDSSGVNLYVGCNQDVTHTYVAYSSTTPNPCTTVIPIDTLKMYQSIATSARLSGRTAQIWWNACGGSSTLRLIAAIDF